MYKKPDTTILCNNLKLLRSTRNLSQYKVASSINLARTTYSAFEHGSFMPDLHTLDSLSVFYNIHIETLVMRDISKGILNRLYLNEEDPHLCEVMNSFHRLSTMSKYLLMQRVSILYERENIFFTECGEEKSTDT